MQSRGVLGHLQGRGELQHLPGERARLISTIPALALHALLHCSRTERVCRRGRHLRRQVPGLRITKESIWGFFETRAPEDRLGLPLERTQEVSTSPCSLPSKSPFLASQFLQDATLPHKAPTITKPPLSRHHWLSCTTVLWWLQHLLHACPGCSAGVCASGGSVCDSQAVLATTQYASL